MAEGHLTPTMYKLKEANTSRENWNSFKDILKLSFKRHLALYFYEVTAARDRLPFKSPECNTFEINECTNSSYVKKGHKNKAEKWKHEDQNWKLLFGKFSYPVHT